MAELVEGQWKDFVFKMAKPEEDASRILELLRHHFYPNEPLCSMMASTEEEFDIMGEDFAPFVRAPLEFNLSFYAEHNETKKIAGVRIIGVERKESPPPPSRVYKNACNEVILQALSAVSLQADIFKAYPEIDQYADLFMTCVDQEFRGQGLATEMYIRAMKLLQAHKFSLCKSVLTSPYTQKACNNLKFTEHARLYMRDFKDEDGKPFFPNAPKDYFITASAKRL